MNAKQMFEKIKRGSSQIIPEDQLLKKLESNKKLKIKLGMDPTSPDLHLGHSIVLEKMKDFQDLGHEIIFLIGDFTARIGDPTGRSKTRPPLTEEQIKHNTQTYFEQVSKILDPKKITIRYNSEWLSKLTAIDIIKICGHVTLAQLSEREDFANRIKNNQPIGMHELLYPLLQGYDSVELRADVELGGTDQTFNLIMGRHLQEKYGQEAQIIVTVPLLEGLDGTVKMSKSQGNSVGLTEPADQAYGKLMSISDDLMWRYYQLLLNKTNSEIHDMKHEITVNKVNPMLFKKQMAHGIILKYWTKTQADNAQQLFEDLVQKKDYSAAPEIQLPENTPNPIWIIDLLRLLGAIKTSSEGKRLIEENAVKINDELVTDFKIEIKWHSGITIKVGKHRFYKIK